MKISEIKDKVPISDFLSKLGLEHVGKSGGELIYHAPYREDKKPSFSSNDKAGKWYDHAMAIGGNIIDLGILVFQTPSVKDVVRRINEMYDGHDLSYLVAKREMLKKQAEIKRHELVKVKPLGYNHSIMTYLDNRGILDVAIRSGIVKEVYYDYIAESGERKRYFGAGWQNNSGGWEVRSKYAKICLSPKDIITKPVASRVTNIFEGMTNYLSALAEGTVSSARDSIVILNGLGLHKRVLDYLKGHPVNEINLFLDNGTGGDNVTAILKEHFPSARDKRDLYRGFSDYNDKFCFEIEQRNSTKLHR